MHVPSIHFHITSHWITIVNTSTNVLRTRRLIQNHYQIPILVTKSHYAHIALSSRKIISCQIKSLVIKWNPNFAIIVRSIVQSISQHQVKFICHYKASRWTYTHFLSILNNQIMSNSCSTNFKHNDISICMSRSSANTSSVYIFIL